MIDDAIARSLDCRVIAGAANNPLTSRAVARTLHERGIVYVPDFLANCGGLIHVASEWYRRREPRSTPSIEHAMERLDLAFETAEHEDAPRRSRPPSARRSNGWTRRGVSAPTVLAEPELAAAERRYARRLDALVRTSRHAQDLRGGGRADRREDQGRRPAHRRPAAVRARARGADAHQPPDAARGDQGPGRGRRARGAPRPGRAASSSPPSWSRASCCARARRSASARSPACSRRAGCSSRASRSWPPCTPSEDDFADDGADRSSASARSPPRDDFLRNEDLFLQLDLKFHLAMARATRNATIVSLMRSLLRHLEIARDMAMHAPLVPDWTIEIHERTLAAIRADRLPADRVRDGRAPRPARADLGEARPGAGWLAARCRTSCSRSPSARGRCAPASAATLPACPVPCSSSTPPRSCSAPSTRCRPRSPTTTTARSTPCSAART